MIARVHSSILQGIDAVACEVEADVSMSAQPDLKLVGMAEVAVRESVSRIQAALRNSGYRWPGPKVVINLAPLSGEATKVLAGDQRNNKAVGVHRYGDAAWNPCARSQWKRDD